MTYHRLQRPKRITEREEFQWLKFLFFIYICIRLRSNKMVMTYYNFDKSSTRKSYFISVKKQAEKYL
jgi:hypothetical protein